MNEVLKTISNRRSIRSFKSEQLKRDDIDSIVQAGLYAPSANNGQNCHFTVIQDGAMIEKLNGWIADEIEKLGNPFLQDLAKRNGGQFFRKAPTIIIVSTEMKQRFGVINAAAAAENMLIAAESLGIGSCWIGSVEILAGSNSLDSYAKELQLPDGYAPQIGITLGYREGAKPDAPTRKQNLVSYIL